MNRIAIDFGYVQLYWYSIFIFLGIAFASIVILNETKRQKINQDFMINLIFYGIVFGLIGARLYYVLFNWDYYSKYPIDILEIWNGGLAIHGAMLFGLATVYIYCKKYKAKFLKIMDILVVGFILAQAIGRWGNFFNGEAYGPITSASLLKSLFIPQFIIDGMFINGAYRIPTFYFESIWNLIGFIVLLVVRNSKYTKVGRLTGVYLIWYSVGRFMIEILRTDSLMLGPIKVAQLVSVIMLVAGIMMIIFCRKGNRFDNLYIEETKEIRF